ncbi:unnamed protein product, partial [Oppiella nova]
MEDFALSRPDAIEVMFGYPNYSPPKHMLEAFKSVTSNDLAFEIHQYADFRGHHRLRAAVAEFNGILMNRKIDANKEVLITVGAIQALTAIAHTYINPGDEVIVFEPFYIYYRHIIELRGGVPVYVPLRPRDGQTARQSNELTFDRKELESKFTNKTKMIWVNNPNNPSGKTYLEEELVFIGELCTKHDVIIISDEFYQFEYKQHLRMATLPGLWNRTLTVNSGGKLFSNTGWRIGW